ncbi:MAG: PAS domain-containing protein [Dyella sp.]
MGKNQAQGAFSPDSDREVRTGMEGEFSRVVDGLPGIIWTALPDGGVDFVNRAWCEYTGRGLPEAAGDGWLAAVHPDDLAELRKGWSSILASHQPQDMRARMRRADGAWRWFVLRAGPVRDAAGKLAHWSVMATDIEDHRASSEIASPSVGAFAMIADALPASVLLMTPDGEIEYSNRQSQEFRGATLEQQRGWKSADLIHPDELPAAIEAWERSVKSGDVFDMEFRARRFDGVYRWFHVRGQPMKDEQGRITRWCTLDVDIDDRKRSEALLATAMAELAASEDRLRATIDTVPGFVWRAAPDGSVEFLNQRWCDYTGLSLADSLGIGWTSVIHPDDGPALGGYWQTLLQAGEPGSFEARLRRSDGTYRWFLIRAVPQRDEAGQVVKWYGQNTDIDDRKRAELLLEGEKRLLEMMASGAPLASVLEALCDMAQTSLDGALCSVVLIDPKYTHAPRDSSSRLRLQTLAAPGTSAQLLEGTDGQPLEPDFSPIVYAAASGETVIADDLIAEVGWDRWRPVALSHGIRASWSTPIRYSCGGVLGVFSALFQDSNADRAHRTLIAQFTHLASIAIERAHSEAALKQSQAFMSKAQRLSVTGTFSWRVGSDEIVWSEEVYRILEIDPSVTPTFALIDTRIHPEDLPAHEEMIRRQRSSPGDFEHEHRLLFPDGRVKWVHLVAHATRSEDGGVEYIAGLQDITQRRLSEEALSKVRSELAHVARVASLGALTASIAHEVNQPLAGIITNASTCLRMLGAEPPNIDGARETARRTIRDGNRASDVIKRLRALFAKKEASTEPLDLNEAAREVVAMLLGELQRHGVVFHPDFADGLPMVSGDRVQLQQVILNLVLNASDAMSDIRSRPRDLRIVTRLQEDGHVRLAVQDSGVGIDPTDSERMFNAFYTTKSSGMGIGLSVSRSIIESHDGRLWAMANEGCGATFAFALPCVRSARARESMDNAGSVSGDARERL